jgi:hypothetical protein
MSSASVSPFHPPSTSFLPKVKNSINIFGSNKPVSKCVPIQPDYKLMDNSFNGNKTSINIMRPM